MADSSPPTPEDVVSSADPGDETARRYRYQWTWAATMCCMLLDDTEDVAEVLCEHHEDILLKHQDGRFTGLQVKTRASDQDVWKVGDPDFRSSCTRFAKLEARFPGQFRAFRFLTNHPLHGGSNSQAPKHVLAQIAGASSLDDLPTLVRRWLRRIATDAGCPDQVTFDALSKTTARDDLPKLRDAVVRLVDTVTDSWRRAADCSHDAVRRAAQTLIDECGRASSLDHEQVLPAYLAASSDPEQAERAARVNGKRMTAARVMGILENGLSATASLDGDPETHVEPGEGSTDLLFRKLDAGGFSAVSRNSGEDLRNKADYLAIKWTKKHGRENGLQRYSHVRSIVLRDSADAFEATKTSSDSFGPAMREALRRRLRQRRDQTFDCSEEHLEGFAYSLTAQCKVQWSLERPWEAA